MGPGSERRGAALGRGPLDGWCGPDWSDGAPPGLACIAFVAGLLTHLAESGFDGCPQHLGWDQYGRDMLSFVPGHVPSRWQQFTDDQVAQAAELLRQLHDATRDWAPILEGEVICHHDPGPNNTVFRDGRPVAFIDFDLAAPGDPLDDVGYMAWAWCISSRPDRGPAAEQARQVRTLADVYGLSPTDRDRLPAAILERLHRNEELWRGILDDDALSIRRTRAAEVLAWTQRELTYIETHQDTFTAVLTST